MSRTMTALALALAVCGATSAFAADSAKKTAEKPAPKTMAAAPATHKAKKTHHSAKKTKPVTSAKLTKPGASAPAPTAKPGK